MSAPAQARPAPSLWMRLAAFGDDATNLRLLGLIVLLVVVFGTVVGRSLFTIAALQSMGFQIPELGILSLAMMISLLSGGLDLAIIATADLCALAMGFVLTHHPALEGIGWLGWQVLALGAGAALATVIGLLNGWVIAYIGVSPILATLGTMTMVRGIAIGFTHGNVISGFPPWVVFLGNGTLLGVPAPLFVFAATAIPLAIMLTRSPLGIAIAMIGSNQQATRFSGIDTRRVLMKVYVTSSLLAAVAALVMMARFNSANADYGQSYLLVTIVAAVLGGVDPLGGFGKVSGLVLALIVLQLISSAFNQLGLSQFLTLAIWGATLIVVSGLPVIWRTIRPSG